MFYFTAYSHGIAIPWDFGGGVSFCWRTKKLVSAVAISWRASYRMLYAGMHLLAFDFMQMQMAPRRMVHGPA